MQPDSNFLLMWCILNIVLPLQIKLLMHGWSSQAQGDT